MRIPIRSDGSPGPIEVLVRGGKYLDTLAVDRFGALFVATAAAAAGGREGGAAVLRRLASGDMVGVASGLRSPRGIAFEAAGHLLVAEAGRLLRFAAPAPPVVTVPAFTNQSPIPMSGRAAPGDLVQAFELADLMSPLAAATADATTGAFTLSVPLAPNAATRLSFASTAAGGLGLTSAPDSHTIVHDDRPPTVVILEPAAGAHVREGVTLRAGGEDDGSGVDSVAFTVDDSGVATVPNPDPAAPLVASLLLDTNSIAEGPHTTGAIAADRASNASSAAQQLVVDRTPPDTHIVSGPSGEIAETTATFTLGASDALSPSFEFAWRLDEGPWSPFSSMTTVVFEALMPGEHRFEAKARDLAGNEDATPVVQTFAVTVLRVDITDPAPGTVVTTPTVWVRGTVQSGGRDVAITVPLPPAFGVAAVPGSAEGDTFAVEVPVDADTTEITVVATDGTGATARDTVAITVQIDPGAPSGIFQAFPAGGLAPLVVTFDAALELGGHLALDLESDGVIDFEGPSVDGLPFVYAQPGVYVASLRVTAEDGRVSTYQTAIEVYDRAAVDARLHAVWTGFTTALQDGDIGRAVRFIHGNRRAAWQEYFGELTAEDLAAEEQLFTTIELVQIGRGGAEYEMLREENGQVYSYPIVFIADVDGRWRLWQF